MLRRINDALPGLVLGIIVYGVIVELAGVWFVTDKVWYQLSVRYGSQHCDRVKRCGGTVRRGQCKEEDRCKIAAPLCCRCDRFLCYDEMESGKSDHCIYRGIGT